MSQYTPKTDGLRLLNYQINRVKNASRKMEKNQKVYRDPLVTIPYKQAFELVENGKHNRMSISDVKKLSEKLSKKLDGDYLNYNPTELRNICNLILIKLSELKKI